ncbi:MAG: site-2 protease family protein [Lentisphaeria bacterium]|nr:site-2 protease family protein [Lentisphaeria bacterium]
MLLDWLFNALAIVFVFFAIGFCIFAHELGHFLAAKWRGLHVDAFSIGFKPFWRKKYGGVEYRLGWIPVGGYCEIPQIDATDGTPKSADGRELLRAKPLDKIVTAVAGPLFNILSGFLIACVIWIWGMPQDTPKMREITIRTIDPAGPEYAAGLRAGDRIVEVNGRRFFATWAKFTEQLIYTIGEIDLTVERSGKRFHVRYVPRENPNAPERLRNEHIAYPFFTPLIPIELVPVPGGVAERAGVRQGDRIVTVNGRALTTLGDFQLALDLSRGAPVKLQLLRSGKPVEVTVTPIPIPGAEPKFTYYLAGVQFAAEPPPERKLVLVGVIPGGAAEQAGVKPGDRILRFNGAAPADAPDFTRMVQENRDRRAKLELRRGEQTLTIELAPFKIVPMGIDAELSLRDHPSPWSQFVATLDMSYKALRGIVIGVGNKLGLTRATSQIDPRHLSGPLGMGTVLFASVRYSTLSTGIYFLVIISFALAIFNLLPLPVLDGGHILFGCIEAVVGRPLPVKVVKALFTVFAGLLILLMVYVTVNDARRLYDNHLKRAFGRSEKTEARP